MSDLVSKISASALSAGLFLVWWPAHVTSQGSVALLVRGVLWAAAFELLLLAQRPLERAVAAAVRDRRRAGLAPRRIAPVLALALVATAVPSLLLSGTRGGVAPATARAAVPRVIVKRETVRRVVVVRRVNRVVRVTVPPAATPATATASAPAVAVRRPATAPAKRSATRPAPSKAARATAADTKSDLPSSAGTTTATEPAATASAPQPSTAAPAAGAASAAAASGR